MDVQGRGSDFLCRSDARVTAFFLHFPTALCVIRRDTLKTQMQQGTGTRTVLHCRIAIIHSWLLRTVMGGIDVFTSGNEGYPCFRIPAALRLPGLILLFAEGRRGGDTGPNDVVYKSSNDEGLTWSPLHVLHSEWKPPGHSWHTFSKNSTFPTTHEYFVRDGYFSAGHDWVKAENATLSAAKVRCSASADCIGFCFNAYDRAPPATQLLHVYYKVAGASFLPIASNAEPSSVAEIWPLPSVSNMPKTSLADASCSGERP